MNEILIRSYRAQDRAAVRRIAWETAFMGAPADAFFSDRKLFEDFLTLYFTDYEPASCFVAEVDKRVVGYLIGAKDERRIAAVMGRIIPGLLLRFIMRDLFLSKDRRFLVRVIASALRGEFKGENFSREYPAILHLNIQDGLRGMGIGSKLIAAYREYLKREGVSGVHLATLSPKAGAFFTRQGFVLLARHTRSYFRSITGGDSEVMIYGLKVEEGI